jgi:hypothetical protein
MTAPNREPKVPSTPDQIEKRPLLVAAMPGVSKLVAVACVVGSAVSIAYLAGRETGGSNASQTETQDVIESRCGADYRKQEAALLRELKTKGSIRPQVATAKSTSTGRRQSVEVGTPYRGLALSDPIRLKCSFDKSRAVFISINASEFEAGNNLENVISEASGDNEPYPLESDGKLVFERLTLSLPKGGEQEYDGLVDRHNHAHAYTN